MLTFQDNKLIFTFNHETLWVEPWGDNAFRIRATKKAAMPQKDWALTQPHSASAVYTQEGEGAAITNGKLTIHVSKRGKITATNQKGQVILEEYCRNRRDLTDPKCSAIEVEGREFAPILGGDYRLTVRFESLDAKEAWASTSRTFWISKAQIWSLPTGIPRPAFPSSCPAWAMVCCGTIRQ